MAKNIKYADLTQEQANKVREMEREFNSKFGTDFYLMVMKEEKDEEVAKNSV